MTPLSPLRSPVHLIEIWAARSQQQARRNAMVASTALAQRRAESAEVEEYLASLTAPAPPSRAATPVPGEDALAAHG